MTQLRAGVNEYWEAALAVLFMLFGVVMLCRDPSIGKFVAMTTLVITALLLEHSDRKM